MGDMQIIGITDLGLDEIKGEIDRGGRFVVFSYAFSLIIITLQRPSDIYFIKGGETSLSRGFKYTLATLVFGWWGIPWGPIHSIQSLFINLSGGRTVTSEALEYIISRQPSRATVPQGEVGGIASEERWLEARSIAACQKTLLYGVLLSVLEFIPLLGLLVMVFAIPFQLWSVNKLGRALNFPKTGIFMLGMLLPVVSLVLLIILNRKAVIKLRSLGVNVGFTGVDPGQIPQL